ncbi:Pkinase-domain-containing protein [Decorospora gaudefroyi]|uniref:Pkinase-domain-containing protein n=1 Tax=Decorospora gaudefroyi TaxID=184978 RepID=A0A6A5KYT5_9PLEO|nr:Pkinase-domain-containing protein [Decorospora gaudefroyi]
MGLTVYNVTSYAPEAVPMAPLSFQAILFPALAFPAWILCLSPMVWHFRQGNIAAGSLVTWIALNNFFNAINALIWPRDNILDWWDGNVWCDINARIQVGSTVGLAAATVMVVRKLARVMDTRNITVSSSRGSKVKEKVWEVVWCWGYPLVIIVVYYVVQPVRYMIYGIIGCKSAYDTSWLSVVLSFMWPPITMAFAAYWAALLVWRLYRYRREFHRLVAARNTTSSRFIRLFIISMVVIFVYTIYAIYWLILFINVAQDPYSWSNVHDPTKFNTIIRIPVGGKVDMNKWVQIATGYVIFALFGTGVDAHNLYKRLLVSMGAGKVWPSLYVESTSGSRTPHSFTAAKEWTSSLGSKAKSMLWSSKSDSTYGGTTRNNSVAMGSIPHLHNVATQDTLLRQKDNASARPLTPKSFFKRVFTRMARGSPVLSFSSYRNIAEVATTDTDRSATVSSPPGFHAHAWAAEDHAVGRVSDVDGVHIIREVHQDCRDRDENEKEDKIEVCGNEQFYLGRDTELCRYSWCDDLTISRLHLRIHCILYEQDPISNISPFVYATDLSANGTYLKKSNAECTASQDPGVLMGRKSTFLLDDEDELRISDTVTLIYYSKKPVELAKLTPIQERERHTFAQRFLVTGRVLGEGGYGKVLVAVNQETHRQLACKLVSLDKMYSKLAVPNLRLPTGGPGERGTKTRKRWPTKVANCFREFDILKDLSHPNVVAIEKVFWSHNTIYIFLELVTGGDLFSYLEYKDGRLGSMQAAAVVRQILKGIEYLHDQDIVHRDLKPDNILMTSLEDGARVVITDFGSARFLPGKNGRKAMRTNKYHRMFSCVGTLEYAAPEIHRANRTIPPDHGYSKSVDMWSIGSITATVLTGDLIFSDRSHPDYHNNPRAVIVGLAAICDLSVLDEHDHPLWSEVGDRPKDFIKGLLILEEEKRMTASEALVHPWFSSYAEDFEDLYARSIADWEPRETDLQLVERITELTPNFAAAGAPGNVRSHDTTSQHFPPSQSDHTHNMLKTQSTSQHWRAKVTSPSIRDDYEGAQFASQAQGTDAAASEHQQAQEPNKYSQYGQHSDKARAQDDTDSQISDHHASNSPKPLSKCGISIGNSLSQLSLTKAPAPGMYNDNADDNEDSDESCESLNRVRNNYSQQGYYLHLPPPPASQDTQQSVLVNATPPHEQVEYADYGYDEHAHMDQEVDGSYFQTQFPYERVTEDEEDSILVHETPPELLRKHGRSSDKGLPTYIQCFHPDEAGEAIDSHTHRKRRKLSNYIR